MSDIKSFDVHCSNVCGMEPPVVDILAGWSRIEGFLQCVTANHGNMLLRSAHDNDRKDNDNDEYDEANQYEITKDMFNQRRELNARNEALPLIISTGTDDEMYSLQYHNYNNIPNISPIAGSSPFSVRLTLYKYLSKS